ncbi:MAG: hypothetical protein H7259_00825 [Cytophagales bacterium]|nr:hypothetical protein [Cytophaga sp.]
MLIQDALLSLTTPTSTIKVRVPSIKIHSPIHSTDFSNIDLHSSIVDNPNINIYSNNHDSVTHTSSSHPFPMPVNLKADDFIINNANIEYISEHTSDTISVSTGVHIHAKGLQTFKEGEQLIQYDHISFDVNDLFVDKNELILNVPKSSLFLTKGLVKGNNKKNIDIHSGVALSWQNVAVQKTIIKDSSRLTIEKISGNFTNDHFTYSPLKKTGWRPLVYHLTITDGAVVYKNKKTILSLGSLSWQPGMNTLAVKSFSMQPRLSRDETFKQALW